MNLHLLVSVFLFFLFHFRDPIETQGLINKKDLYQTDKKNKETQKDRYVAQNKSSRPSMPVRVPSYNVYENLVSPSETKLDKFCCREFQVWKLLFSFQSFACTEVML